VSEASQARRYLRSHRAGVLSTLSVRLGGYPFGSIVPFVLDGQCRPVILISTLAEHTANLAADPRASLIVHDYAQDVQAGTRLTLVGDAQRLADPAPVQALYLRFFPAAQELLALGDFSFWAVTPARLLFIRGFGRIHWIEASAFAPPPNRLAEVEEEIVAHMNGQHLDAIVACCRHVHAIAPRAAAMVGIDVDGFDVRADGRLLRFDFDAPVTNAAKARAALGALARAARGE